MLGRHLNKMKKLFPKEYDFFPTTYMLPHDFKDFWDDKLAQKVPRTYIVKPENECQGKGIFLTRTPEEIKPDDHVVIQKYMHKPHLIDGFKYDLRIYVFLNGINPLRVYIYKDGLARFATELYQKPSDKNISNLCMHLTNYAINKESENFVANTDKNNDDVGSKRSLQSVLDGIDLDYGTDVMEKVQKDIYDIIIKTLCLATPHVTHLMKSCHPDDIEN